MGEQTLYDVCDAGSRHLGTTPPESRLQRGFGPVGRVGALGVDVRLRERPRLELAVELLWGVSTPASGREIWGDLGRYGQPAC